MRLVFVKVIKCFHFYLHSFPDETLGSSREKKVSLSNFYWIWGKVQVVFFKKRTKGSCFVWASSVILKSNLDYWILHFNFNDEVVNTIKHTKKGENNGLTWEKE